MAYQRQGRSSFFDNQRVLMFAGRAADSRTGGDLGLGDLLRVVALIPGFQAQRVDWCSDAMFFPLVQDCQHITELFDTDELESKMGRYDSIFNLTFEKIPSSICTINIADLVAGEGELKSRTYDFSEMLVQKLALTLSGEMPVVHPSTTPDYDVGFNWQTPPEWQTKELPYAKWLELEDLLPSQLRITWQLKDDSLDHYISWIKHCRLIVSSVGLGAHIAMYYGVKLVMLSGPTDFSEAHHYRDGRILYPPSLCEYRPCYRRVGQGCCECMNDFRSTDIATEVMALLSTPHCHAFATEGSRVNTL